MIMPSDFQLLIFSDLAKGGFHSCLSPVKRELEVVYYKAQTIESEHSTGHHLIRIRSVGKIA